MTLWSLQSKYEIMNEENNFDNNELMCLIFARHLLFSRSLKALSPTIYFRSCYTGSSDWLDVQLSFQPRITVTLW